MSCAKGCCPSPREHYRSLRFYSQGTGPIHARDRQYDKDAAAYRRLRQNGLQPPQIDGCAFREQVAKTTADVEQAKIPRSIYAVSE